jgi:hypothetical protein
MRAPGRVKGGINTLCRANLSPAERAKQIARRKDIYEELHPETRHSGDRKSSRNLCDLNDDDRFTSNTAAAVGKSERVVQIDAERGKKISDENRKEGGHTCKQANPKS